MYSGILISLHYTILMRPIVITSLPLLVWNKPFVFDCLSFTKIIKELKKKRTNQYQNRLARADLYGRGKIICLKLVEIDPPPPPILECEHNIRSEKSYFKSSRNRISNDMKALYFGTYTGRSPVRLDDCFGRNKRVLCLRRIRNKR